MSKNCFISWSGGKDSCMALYKAMQLGFTPQILMTMFNVESGISAAHRQKEQIFDAQADALGFKSIIVKTPFDDYEKNFVDTLKSLKQQGIDYGIFGDMDVEPHREWVSRVCQKASMEAVLPLWQTDRHVFINEFFELGFKAKIVLVDTKVLGAEFLGQDLSLPLIKEMEQCGADICGENGEYHTLIYDGPVFHKPVDLKHDGTVFWVEDRWAQIKAFV